MAKVISDSWVMGPAKNIKKSVAFYAKLGLKPSMRMPFYVEFKIPGGTALGLHSMKNFEKKRSRGGGFGIMLRVKGIEKLAAVLRRKGVRCSKVRTAPGGAKFSSFSDPDGNGLTLIQMT
jgi:catechol 2,3-dioxygenase-like lactoylglutathione lyase family enzyme